MRDRAVCLLICPLTWSGWDGRQRQHRRSNNDKSKRIVYNKGVKKTKKGKKRKKGKREKRKGREKRRESCRWKKETVRKSAERQRRRAG